MQVNIRVNQADSDCTLFPNKYVPNGNSQQVLEDPGLCFVNLIACHPS